MANCKECIRCKSVYSSYDLTPDGFGDSSVGMCSNCLYEVREDNSKFLLVETPDYMGTTFVFKQELQKLKEYWGEDEVKVLKAK